SLQQEKLLLPRTLDQARDLGDVLQELQKDSPIDVMLSFFLLYVALQTFAIPGSIFLTILSGALFSFPVAVLLVCTAAAMGATFCYCLSYIFGKGLVLQYFPERVESWQRQIQHHHNDMVNYIIFLRVTPLLPNWFINISSPVLHVAVWPFFIGTFIGVAPPSIFFIQAGQVLSSLGSTSEVIGPGRVVLLLLLGLVSLAPIIFKKRFAAYGAGQGDRPD
ncbi:hypothetical protein SARC_08321, partial [Sphaeroforma arctica JP610]